MTFEEWYDKYAKSESHTDDFYYDLRAAYYAGVNHEREQSARDSWINSPDRMGGQFTDQELLDRYQNRW